MTGEEVLRTLAADCARNVNVAGEHKQEAMLSARPFLTGAMIALHRANAFTKRTNPKVLLEQLLAPIEQPLVDTGVIERVSVGFESTATASAAPTPEEEGERYRPGTASQTGSGAAAVETH